MSCGIERYVYYQQLVYVNSQTSQADLTTNKIPVIYGAPPPPESTALRAKRTFANGTHDNLGGPHMENTAATRIKKRTHPSKPGPSNVSKNLGTGKKQCEVVVPARLSKHKKPIAVMDLDSSEDEQNSGSGSDSKYRLEQEGFDGAEMDLDEEEAQQKLHEEIEISSDSQEQRSTSHKRKARFSNSMQKATAKRAKSMGKAPAKSHSKPLHHGSHSSPITLNISDEVDEKQRPEEPSQGPAPEPIP
jgi:hypothetical protein